MRNAGLEETQAGIKIAGRNINNLRYAQNYGFSSSHVWMWELDYKESQAPKNWCFWTAVLEKTLESPWTERRSNQSVLKETSPEYSLEGRTDVETETQ